jgi:hypothetical protein
MNIPFEGKLSKKEYRQVMALHLKLPGWQRWFFTGAALLLIFSAVFQFIRFPELATSLLPVLVFPTVFLTFPLWLPEIQASSYNQPGNIFREGLLGTITDSEIAIQTAKGNSSTFWTAFTHYKSTENIIMLYQNKNCFNIFTQSMFASAEDWNTFCGEVARRLPKK